MVTSISIQQQADSCRIHQEARKVMSQQSALFEKKLEVKKQKLESKNTRENQTKKEDKPQHNSLQHDSTISVPLLTLLVDALKKEKRVNKDDLEETDESDTLETITGDSETKKESKDAIVALADRIKRLYTNELMQQAYMQAAQGNYSTLGRYQNELGVQASNVYKATYQQDDYGASKKNEDLEKKRNESSTYSKLAGGDKPQAFIMTDPRGRLHSTWEIVRILNETADGKIERNDGLHYQGLS